MTPSVQQNTQTSTAEVWEKYYQALIQTVAGNVDYTKQAVSLAGSTLVIDVGNADPAVSNDYIFLAGNTLPAWSPSYTPTGGLLSTYATFLDNINLGGSIDPNMQSQINIAQSNSNAAQSNFTGANGVQSQAIAAWTQYKAIDPNIDFLTFVQTQFPLYLQAKQALQAAESALQELMIQAYGAGYSVIADARNKCLSTAGAAAIDLQNKYNMAIKTGSTTPAGSGPNVLPGTNPPAAPSSLISSFAPAFGLDGFAEAYAEWQSNSVHNVVAETITVTGDSAAGQWSDYGWSASGGANLFDDFFSFTAQGSASSNTQTVNTQSSEFSMTVSFAGLQTFSIAPGQWYDGGIVETYKNQLLPTAPQSFGEGGSMALLPTELIIGFEPSITLTLENSDYNSFKNQYQAQATASLNIGPFSIGDASYSTYGDKTDISYDDAKSSITVGPVRSTLPLLLGVISTKL